MVSLLHGGACFNPGLSFELHVLIEAGLSGSVITLLHGKTLELIGLVGFGRWVRMSCS